MPSVDLLSAFTTLFVIVDPIALVPIFLVMTSWMTVAEKRSVALYSTMVAGAILVLFAVAGSSILKVLGITLPAFRLAGGLLLFWIAFEMVFSKRQDRKEAVVEESLRAQELRNIAVFPLAVPMLSGPGAISAAVVLATDFHSPLARLILIGIIVVVMGLTLAVFYAAEPVDRLIGQTGRLVFSRLFGVLLAALAVQIAADGARELLHL